MRLILHINILFFLVCCSNFAQSQERDTSFFTIESKYKAEYSPYFKFKTFKRGASKSTLNAKLQELSNKPKPNWTFNDSLEFAKTNLLVNNIKLGKHYFKNTFKNPRFSKQDNLHYLAAYYLNQEFKEGLNKLNKDYTRVIQYTELYFLKHIFASQDSLAKNNHWYKANGNVLLFNIDSNLVEIDKKSDLFTQKIIIPIQNANHILEILVNYVHEDDPILACAFNNLGTVLENHVSLSQAYIAYSIGRNYNKKDKVILENIKRVKAKLTAKNYKIPNFRKYFPKTEKGRFEYEILKEKIIKEQNDTIPKHVPTLLEKKEKIVDIPFPIDTIIPIGILIIFIFTLLFLRKKK